MKCFMCAWLFALCLAEEWEVVHLLQQRVVVQQKTLPMYWVHFPKAGSSFVNVLVQQPGFCRLGQDIMVDEEHLGQCFLTKFMDLCWEKCDPQHLQCQEEIHECLGTKFFEVEGRMVGMFRQPEQRILSMYYDSSHNFLNHDVECPETPPPYPPLSVFKEAQLFSGTLFPFSFVAAPLKMVFPRVTEQLRRRWRGFTHYNSPLTVPSTSPASSTPRAPTVWRRRLCAG